MPHKLRILTTLMRNTPKFSGCGFNAIPKNDNEFKQLRRFEPFTKENGYQDQLLKHYKDKYEDNFNTLYYKEK